ncbi:hypothetical protein FQN57_000478 [Myotisia sp. PD_48]|nr:hypothetical protein FQN57_000478 [Myotisia sp. PD_48]
MKLNIAALSALAVVVAAIPQNSATPTTAALSPETSCVLACGPADVCCKAACVGVPCPNENNANDTTECAAKCPQGNGSPSETENYARCQQACISSLFFTATGGSGPRPTNANPPANTSSGSGSQPTGSQPTGSNGGSRPSGTEGGEASGSGSPTETGSERPSGTTSGSGSASSTGAASTLKLGSSAAGVFGLVLAALAL